MTSKGYQKALNDNSNALKGDGEELKGDGNILPTHFDDFLSPSFMRFRRAFSLTPQCN